MIVVLSLGFDGLKTVRGLREGAMESAEVMCSFASSCWGAV
jgi:hypothetical protein